MVKRAFDVMVAVLALIVTAPLMAACVCAVRLSSPGPIFFRATRVGRGGVPFRIFKFRTMRVGGVADQALITRAGDPRVTAVGRWLRKSKLDELPQLFNVLTGDMSLVGPRPEDPAYVALYDERQRAVLAVRPGITSRASVEFRDEESQLVGDDWHETYVNVIMPAKLNIELEYLREQSFLADVRIIAATVRAIVRPGPR